MILGLIFILLVGLVAFFHFTQGFFSATISAIIAVISAMIAIGWHEDLVMMIKPGKFADSANAMLLCGLYGVTYIVCRTIFDKLVPGNMRFPSTIDKIGAALMGIVAGVCGTGIAAIAVQSMDFGPSIGGYSRYALGMEREVRVQGAARGQALDRKVYDEVKSPTFEPSEVSSLIFPVDSIVLGMASTISSGVLSGRSSFSDVHPDYLQELFGQRLGIEIGARRTAANWSPGSQVEVKGVFLYVPTLNQRPRDAETPEVRGGAKTDEKKPLALSPMVETMIKTDTDYKWLVVRIEIKQDARDPDDYFRFSPGAARLVIKDGNKFHNFYPIGTLDWQFSFLWASRIDDPLIVNMKDDPTVDLVYKVPPGVLEPDNSDAKKGGVQFKLPPGTFFEMKRLARADLTDESEGGGPVKLYTQANAPHPPGPSLLRKQLLDPRLQDKPTPPAAP